MTSNYYQKHKKSFKKKHLKDIKILIKKKKKRQKMSKNRYQNLFKKKKKKEKRISIIVNAIRIFLRKKSKSMLSV